MRKAQPRKIHAWFRDELTWLSDLEKQIPQDPQVAQEVREWHYEMLAVSAASLWEQFAEDLFFAYVNRKPDKVAEMIGLPTSRKHLSLPLCEALFTTPGGYVDFRSYGDFVKRGSDFCFDKDRNPFKAVPNNRSARLDDLLIIRNHILHQSAFSYRKYERLLRSKYDYSRVPEPGTFLRKKIRPGASNLTNYLRALRNLSRDIEKSPYA